MAVLGGLGAYFWGSWLGVPFFLVYGVLYGSASDWRWHECGHGTAFKTHWMNDAVYQIACFMIIREPTVWRWSHTRHHTDTIIVGRDPRDHRHAAAEARQGLRELLRPGRCADGVPRHGAARRGRLTADEGTFIPETERPQGVPHGAHLAR